MVNDAVGAGTEFWALGPSVVAWPACAWADAGVVVGLIDVAAAAAVAVWVLPKPGASPHRSSAARRAAKRALGRLKQRDFWSAKATM